MYRDFIAGRAIRGLQHVAYWTESYDADLARLTAQGFKPVMGGEVGERGRFIYFDTRISSRHRDRAVGSRRPEGQAVPADPRGRRRLGRQRSGAAVPRPQQALTCRIAADRFDGRPT